MTRAGLPHSEMYGSLPACGSPYLFAAYRVLHRLSMPRHPPYALCSLITFLPCPFPHNFVATALASVDVPSRTPSLARWRLRVLRKNPSAINYHKSYNDYALDYSKVCYPKMSFLPH